ncbi:MAG: CRISPR-associated protein Cas4 [Planctomycetes bacterium]|nr:CRISPR-associated protein Cas4 [Planctomycetota bacterium]
MSHYAEADLLPLSRIVDLVFCPRRAALHLVESIWEDNVFTAEGTVLHERTHESGAESRDGIITARSLRIHSLRLGLVGMADVLDFRPSATGASLPGREGFWQPYPVEYKRGIRKDKIEYRIQLCAQALCLEEMLHAQVPRGALFYGKSRRRYEVEFDTALREQTEAAAARLHELFDGGKTPTAKYEKKCESCSLLERCLPQITGVRKNVRHYLSQAGRDE